MALNPLLDKEFLRELTHSRLKTTYAKLIALNRDGETLETIEANVSSGSINIDGTSSVRRTCSLSLVAEELNIHEFYWGLRTKFKLFIGLENTIDYRYPDIIWFPFGVFVISSFTTAQGTSSYTISIQGKDKMTLLNGELGGTIMSLTHNFGDYDYTNEYGYTITQKNLIKDIIIDAVHEFGKEPLYNIIVNDLDDYGIELMEYRNKEPMYLLIDEETQEPLNMTLDGSLEYILANDTSKKIALKDIEIYNPLFDLEQDSIIVNPTVIMNAENRLFTVAKLEYGMTAGYRLTDIVYPGDLISNVGESVTSMLDKLITMLGEFEYFYDIDGRFIFQRRKTYINTSWNNIRHNLDETYVDSAVATSAISFSFEDSMLISSYSNSPNIAELKNDYSVWGTRKSVTGKELPVHMRFAIDEKPTMYTNYENNVYTVYTEEEYKEKIHEYGGNVSLNNKIISNIDWREIIYQMALDFRGHNREDDFYIQIRKNNPYTCPKGMTGYEQYYIDMEGFWRQLYNPEYDGEYERAHPTKVIYDTNPAEYYYDEVKYTQCAITEPYHSKMIYYTYQPDIIKGTNTLQRIEIDKDSYEKNPELYYYINTEMPYEILNCIIIEAYRDLDPSGYYIKSGETFNKVAAPVPKSTYENMPEKYYYMANSEIKPCFKIAQYMPGYTYYSWDTGEKVSLTEEKYNESPWLFYRIEKEYKQCTAAEPYSETTQYYKLEYAPRTDIPIYPKVKPKKEQYEAKPEQYYTYVRDINVESITALLPYNAKYKYLDKDGQVLSNIDENIYSTLIQTANIYYEDILYLCCKRAKDYAANDIYYLKATDKYTVSGWHKDVYESPELLNFWFDFMDNDSELQKYSAHNIGNRSKAVNDNSVKSIYFRETPTVIFVNQDKWEEQNQAKLGYTYIQLPEEMENVFSISAQGKSAKNVLDNLLYRHACCAESITLSSIPIYHLEPNTRIFVRDDKSGINGEYIMTRYSLPLGSSGSMSITATKAVDRLY